MFIVIEGTDASGKSSLTQAVEEEIASRLQSRLPINSFHKGKPEEETRRWVLRDYVLSIEDKSFVDKATLADRWHWGEITYAPLKRPHTNKDGYGLLGEAGWRWVELFMASRGIQQFWLYQPLSVIEGRLKARGDDYVLPDELPFILEQYGKAAEQIIGLKKLQPAPDSLDEIPNLAKEIVDLALVKAESVRALRDFGPYIGVPKPKVLLVGDRHNATKRYGHETNLPFMPVDGNSGEYLLTALPADEWKNIGLININDHPEMFRSLWEALGCPPIVALGRLAERGLVKQGFIDSQYNVAPHPQRVRRFANSRKQEYGEAILRLADTTDKEDKWILR